MKRSWFPEARRAVRHASPSRGHRDTTSVKRLAALATSSSETSADLDLLTVKATRSLREALWPAPLPEHPRPEVGLCSRSLHAHARPCPLYIHPKEPVTETFRRLSQNSKQGNNHHSRRRSAAKLCWPERGVSFCLRTERD